MRCQQPHAGCGVGRCRHRHQLRARSRRRADFGDDYQFGDRKSDRRRARLLPRFGRQRPLLDRDDRRLGPLHQRRRQCTGNVFVITQNGQGYQDESYNNHKCTIAGDCDGSPTDPVAVTLGATTTGIDFALDPGGRISGTVKDINNSPLANVEVRTYDSTGNQVDEVSRTHRATSSPADWRPAHITSPREIRSASSTTFGTVSCAPATSADATSGHADFGDGAVHDERHQLRPDRRARRFRER